MIIYNHDKIIEELKLHLLKHGNNVCACFEKYKYNFGSEKRFEADLLRIDFDGRISEYEVKTSYNDFINDFAKYDRTRIMVSYKSNKTKNESKLKCELVLAGKRCNKFYYVVSRELYNKIPGDVRSSYGYVIYDLINDNKYKFFTLKNSPIYKQDIELDSKMIFRLCFEYRQINKNDLNLKDFTNEQLMYHCIINSDTYVPRLRKTKNVNCDYHEPGDLFEEVI